MMLEDWYPHDTFEDKVVEELRGQFEDQQSPLAVVAPLVEWLAQALRLVTESRMMKYLNKKRG